MSNDGHCTMKVKLFVLHLICAMLLQARATSELSSLKEVKAFNHNDQRALDILKELAEQERVIIGVSGVLVGSDDKLLSISTGQTSLGAILNLICLKDPRYRWRDGTDGSIVVDVGNKRLSLLDLNVNGLEIKQANKDALILLISERPEVKKWEDKMGCTILRVVAGDPSMTIATREVNLIANRMSLRMILDATATQSQTYFWSVFQISDKPCTINLNP